MGALRKSWNNVGNLVGSASAGGLLARLKMRLMSWRFSLVVFDPSGALGEPNVPSRGGELAGSPSEYDVWRGQRPVSGRWYRPRWEVAYWALGGLLAGDGGDSVHGASPPLAGW